MKMAEAKHRIRMKSGWTGKIDGEEQTVKAGEVVDVDDTTCRALVYQYDKAELVPLEEIIKEAKKTPKQRRIQGVAVAMCRDRPSIKTVIARGV
jgi:hypothetical protein